MPERDDPGGSRGRAAPSLGTFIDALASRHGDRTALVYGDRTVSFAALAEESRRVARGLADLGIGRGDRVALWLPNVPAWPVLHFALGRLGAVAVAVNTRFRESEVADIVGRSGARLLVLWPGFKGIDFLGILAGCGEGALARLERLVLYDEGEDPPRDPGWPTVRLSDLAGRPPLARDQGGAGDGTLIFTTSGTTRAPKLVLHPQRSLTAHAAEVAPAFGYDRDGAALLQALPLCGTFGHAQIMAALAGGAPSVLLPAFDAGAAAEAVRDNRVTHLNGSDEMFWRLFEAARPGDLDSLRACGFASFNPGLGDLVAAGDGRGVAMHGLYGMSECQALFARQPPDAEAERRGCGGGLLTSPSARVRVRDPETGRRCETGESGEIEVAGPSLMAGYDGDPEATAAARTDDGCFRTGDLGFLTEDGGFVFRARLGDVLRLGGFLVSLAEIEAHLETHPAVAAAQVVGAEAERGPAAVAFVVPAEGAGFDGNALLEHCRAGLARFKVPAAVYALEAFPAADSPNGRKIQRGRLREMAAARLRDSH